MKGTKLIHESTTKLHLKSVVLQRGRMSPRTRDYIIPLRTCCLNRSSCGHFARHEIIQQVVFRWTRPMCITKNRYGFSDHKVTSLIDPNHISMRWPLIRFCYKLSQLSHDVNLLPYAKLWLPRAFICFVCFSNGHLGG